MPAVTADVARQSAETPAINAGLEALMIADSMRAFVDTGLIDLVERLQPVSSETLARRAHLALRPVALLLTVLGHAGVVERSSATTWRLTAAADAWRSMIGLSVVSPFLDRGVGAVDIGDPARRDRVGAEYRRAGGVIASVVRPVAEAWAPRLAQPGGRVLEIAAGAGPWTRALLAREPTMNVTLIDLPPVIDEHRPSLMADHPEAALQFVAGDVFTTDLRDRFDLIVISAFCRLFDAAHNELLLRRVAGWLAPGGKVAIADAIARPGAADRSLAVYELSLAARSERGCVYGVADFAGWMTCAGLREPRLHPSSSQVFSVLTTSW